jgi:hypothetical protein
MAQVKTYLLAPNFTFRPDGPIALGNIIADPFKPKRALSTLDPLKPSPAIETILDYDYIINREKGQNSHLGVWLRFLETLRAGLQAKHGHEVLTQYKMDSIETSYFKSDPTEEEIAERVKTPRVRTAMRSGIFGSRPVYMITGIKVAKGFVALEKHTSADIANVEASATVSPNVSVGADVGGSAWNAELEGFRSGGDRIFAYQLAIIKEKGRKEKTVIFKEYEPKAAFLSYDRLEQEEEELGVDASDVTATDLLEDAGELSLETMEVRDRDGTCVCISFRDI